MCQSSCQVCRCRGCPATDWSAFTWLWEQPASEDSVEASGIERQFQAASQAMVYPGVCDCLWLVSTRDRARSLDAAQNPTGAWFPIASLGALQYQKLGQRFVWTVTITRWATSYVWDIDDPRYGGGWGWDDAYFGLDCNYLGGGWGGWGGFGWGGYGWGYGYGLGWNNYGSAESATYVLAGEFRCSGEVNVFELLVAEGIEASHWPAWVHVSRVPTGGTSGASSGGSSGGEGSGGSSGGGPIEGGGPPAPPPP